MITLQTSLSFFNKWKHGDLQSLNIEQDKHSLKNKKPKNCAQRLQHCTLVQNPLPFKGVYRSI